MVLSHMLMKFDASVRGPMSRFAMRLSIVCVVVGALFLSGCTQGKQPNEGDKSSVSPAEGQGHPGPSNGVDLKISEKGMTATSFDGEPMITFGMVIENKSPDNVANINVATQILDADGEPIKDMVSQRTTNNFQIHHLAPGEKQVVTDRTYVETKGAEDVSAKISEAVWYDGDDARFQQLSISEPETELDDGRLELEFTVTSPFEDDVDAVTRAIFRDDSGAIVGGSSLNDVSKHRYKPGENYTTMEVSAGLPPGVDEASVEIYASPRIENLG